MDKEHLNDGSLSNSDEISVKELVSRISTWYRYLLSRWKLIMAISFLGAALGLTYAFFAKPSFTATTTIVLESGESGGGLGQYAGIASMVGIDLGGGSGGLFQGDNIIELYKSRTMIVKALLTEFVDSGKKELLIDRYIKFNRLRDSWSEKPGLRSLTFSPGVNGKATTFSRLQDSVLTSIATDINLHYLDVGKLDKKLSIIKVDVKAKDEVFAKTFNDEIVKQVNDFYVQTKTKKSLQNISILQQKADSVRMMMNGAIYSAAAVADATPNLNPTRQVQRVAPMQRSQFAAETNKAILSELVKNLEISKMALSRERPLIQVVDQPVYPLEKYKFGKLKGIVLGGFLAGFLITVFLFIKKLISE